MKRRIVASLVATMMVVLTASPAFATSENVRKRVRPIIEREQTPCFVGIQAAERAPQCAAGA